MDNLHRTHHCNELTVTHIGQQVTLMGWVHAKRNLGGLLFIDLRDHYGVTQAVVRPDSPYFEIASNVRQESVLQVKGVVFKRESINTKLHTGDIEVISEFIKVESTAEILPFPVVNNPKQEAEDTRLRYRFLDLRTEKLHRNIMFYNGLVRELREQMWKGGFTEFQTPILTSSSPEGARDFLVPSRLHPGKFYALPQAPQQFKQLLMCSGFDRYYQIAPCFRDEDPRADRAPGEFYQLDIEMAYATQPEVFKMAESLVDGVFSKLGSHKKIMQQPFPQIPWLEAMEKYGSDKPDLRFACEMISVDHIFINSSFALFQNTIQEKGVLKAIKIKGAAAQSRKFFDELDAFAKEQGLGGAPWLSMDKGEWKGSIAKVVSDTEKQDLVTLLQLESGDAVVFILGKDKNKTLNRGGKIRLNIANKLQLINKDIWAFCWIVDFPMFEYNEDEQKVEFSHNPFSMPQGGLEALNTKNPVDILAYQYDCVLDGYEVASGAVRNHKRDIMTKAFETAGYTAKDVEDRFGALWTAFNYGPPPHAGMAFGIARMVMILLDEPNIREVIGFPLNGRAQDLLMQAPNSVEAKQLKDVHVAVLSK